MVNVAFMSEDWKRGNGRLPAQTAATKKVATSIPIEPAPQEPSTGISESAESELSMTGSEAMPGSQLEWRRK